MLHWNIPHLPGIYNREMNHITWDGASNYFDNLELVDAAIGEVRAAMTAAGLWDDTSIIVTSDHPLRASVWEPTNEWTTEEASLAAQRRSKTVPFLIKLAGRTDGIVL